MEGSWHLITSRVLWLFRPIRQATVHTAKPGQDHIQYNQPTGISPGELIDRKGFLESALGVVTALVLASGRIIPVSMSQKQKLTEYACGLPAEELSYGLTPVLSALQRVQQASIPAPVLQGSASVHQSGNAETSSSVRPSRGPASSAGASSSA